MTLHRVARDEQLATDFAQREVALEQGQNLELTIRQRLRLGSGGIETFTLGGEGPLEFGAVLFEDACVAEGFQSRRCRFGVDACRAAIDEHKDRHSAGLRWGIEPICGQLPIAPATNHSKKNRAPSARTLRDRQLRPEILPVWEQNLCVYGADKVWDQLNKDGARVARCTIERLVADMGLRGCRRGRISVRTAIRDDTLDRSSDLVERCFKAFPPEPGTDHSGLQQTQGASITPERMAELRILPKTIQNRGRYGNELVESPYPECPCLQEWHCESM